MNVTQKLCLSFCAFISCSIFSMHLVYTDAGYQLQDKDGMYHINKDHVDKALSGMNAEQFKRFVEAGGAVNASKHNDGDYFLSVAPQSKCNSLLHILAQTKVGVAAITAVMVSGATLGGLLVGGPAGAVVAAATTSQMVVYGFLQKELQSPACPVQS